MVGMRKQTLVSESTGKKDYSKKIKLCKALGAEKFQKVVFAAERLKFKILKKCFPNFISFYEKRCDSANKRWQKKARTEEDKKHLNAYYQQQKLIMRKEWNQEQNRNYHIDKGNPTDFLNYLNWNKRVHVRGLIKNMIILPICIGFSCAGFGILGIVGAYEFLSMMVNFECVNIQNYNIYRIKQKEERLRNIARRSQQRDVKRYEEASQLICDTLDKSKTKIPSLTEIINNIQTPEQLSQMRAFLTAMNSGQSQAHAKTTGSLK